MAGLLNPKRFFGMAFLLCNMDVFYTSTMGLFIGLDKIFTQTFNFWVRYRAPQAKSLRKKNEKKTEHLYHGVHQDSLEHPAYTTNGQCFVNLVNPAFSFPTLHYFHDEPVGPDLRAYELSA